MLAIYAPYVEETPITFETAVPAIADFAARVENILPGLPWLVAESEGQINGYAYASRHHERAAYGWSVDVSVYLAQNARGRGIGRRLYQRLLAILTELGYYNAFAGIALPNPASVGMHESFGFEPIGVYRKAGYKFGLWHDVGWWQLTLRSYQSDPVPPQAFSTWQQTNQIE
jgi:phosphinothricin acetyltransferase